MEKKEGMGKWDGERKSVGGGKGEMRDGGEKDNPTVQYIHTLKIVFNMLSLFGDSLRPVRTIRGRIPERRLFCKKSSHVKG